MRIVVFDLDDTLYREWDFVKGGFKKVSRYIARISREPVVKIYRALLRIYFLYGRNNTFGRLLKELQLENRCKVITLVNIYRTHPPKLALFDDAKDTLSSLSHMQCRLGMITDGNDKVQKSKVSALGIGRYFSSIIYPHEFGINYYKPNPFSYNMMAKNLNCAFKDMIYVGDNPFKDFVTAKKLGIMTIRVMRGPFSRIIADQEHDAHIKIDSFYGFAQWLKDHG